jgi:myo-inositol 2-dehydrogenase/D-chiro-inositol 1-dehydrogenase
VAILGAGGVAQAKYLPALARLRAGWEQVELVALSTLDERQAEKLRATWHVSVHRDSSELLRQHLPEAVLVTSSDDAHTELALAALEAGAHVLVEKPLARTLRDAHRVVEAAERRNRILVTACNKRYSPPYAHAHTLLDNGAVPSPSLLYGRFALGYDYVDLLHSGTIHLFDLVRHLLGDIVRVSATAPSTSAQSRRGSGPAQALVECEFACGARGSLLTTATALSLQPWERLEIFGDGAWLSVEDQTALTLYPGEYEPARTWRPVAPNTLVSAEEWGGYVGMLDDFLAAVRRDGEPVTTSRWDGYRACEVVAATELSLERGEPVALPLPLGE